MTYPKRIDLHCDTLIRLAGGRRAGDLARNECQVDLERLRSSGALLQFFAVYLSEAFDKDMEKVYAEFRRVRGYLRDQEDRYPELFSLVTGLRQLEETEKRGGLGALLTIEDGAMINGKPERLLELYDAGVRLVTLTWNYENCLGYPNSPDPEIMAKGLKPFGIETVRRMDELGMIIDVSHLSDGGFWDVLRHSRRPVMASHSNARSMTPHRRNLTDEMIRALADQGGVMGLNFCPSFVGSDPEYTAVADLVRQAAWIRRVGGAGVLALGSDYDGIGGVQELRDCTEYGKLYDALKEAGFTSSELEQVWNQNALRVIRSVLR